MKSFYDKAQKAFDRLFLKFDYNEKAIKNNVFFIAVAPISL